MSKLWTALTARNWQLAWERAYDQVLKLQADNAALRAQLAQVLKDYEATKQCNADNFRDAQALRAQLAEAEQDTKRTNIANAELQDEVQGAWNRGYDEIQRLMGERDALRALVGRVARAASVIFKADGERCRGAEIYIDRATWDELQRIAKS